MGKTMTSKQKINSLIQGYQCATMRSIIVNLAGNPRVCMSYNMYYNAVSSKLEILLSLTNKKINREDQKVNDFKRSGSSKYRFRTNHNSDKKKKTKPDSTTRTHFVPEDCKYSFKEWKVLLDDQ